MLIPYGDKWVLREQRTATYVPEGLILEALAVLVCGMLAVHTGVHHARAWKHTHTHGFPAAFFFVSLGY